MSKRFHYLSGDVYAIGKDLELFYVSLPQEYRWRNDREYYGALDAICDYRKRTKGDERAQMQCRIASKELRTRRGEKPLKRHATDGK